MAPSKFDSIKESVSGKVDSFVADRFANTNKGKQAQERIDNRYYSNPDALSYEATTDALNLKGALQNGQTQLLTERPAENLSKENDVTQALAWEVNVVTEKEGESKDALKGAFEATTKARETHFKRHEMQPSGLKVIGLKNIETGNTEVMSKKDILDPATIENYVNTRNAEKPLVWESSVAADLHHNNVDKVFTELYGARLQSTIDAFCLEKLVDARIPGDASSAFIDQTAEMLKLLSGTDLALDLSDPEVISYDILTDTLKTLLIQNPESIKDILTVLADDGELDLNSIPEFWKTFGKSLLKYGLDKIERENPELFDYTQTGIIANAQDVATDNRKLLAERMLSPDPAATGPISLSQMVGGTKDVDMITRITQDATVWKDYLDGNPTYTSISAHRTVAPPHSKADRFDSFKNNAFQGLTRDAELGMAALLNRVGIAMTHNPLATHDIFKISYENAVVVGGDSTQSTLKRMNAFLKAQQALDAIPTTSLTVESAVTDTIGQMDRISQPEAMVQSLQYELFTSFATRINTLISVVPVPVEYTGLNIADLQTDFQVEVATGHISPVFLERLSTLTIALPEAERVELLKQLRGLANTEIIRELAAEVSGASTGQTYNENLSALFNRFIFNDSGTATPATSAELANQLIDLMHNKAADAEAIKIKIGANADLKRYLETLRNDGTTIDPALELSINGVKSDGEAFSRAHQLLGIIRRAAEAGEWMDLRTQTDTEKKDYLKATLKLNDGPELDEALARFNSVIGAAGAAALGGRAFNLVTLLDSANRGESTDFGEKFTNTMRLYRHYIRYGGDMEKIMEQAVSQQFDKYMMSLQKQSNKKLGVEAGEGLVDRQRSLNLEELRAAAGEKYLALEGKSGWRKVLDIVKSSLPRVGKALFWSVGIGIGTSLFPVLAAPAGLLLAGFRIYGAYKLATDGIPQIYKAVKAGNWKAGVAAGVSIGINSLLMWGLGGSIGGILGIGAAETVATVVAQSVTMSREVKRVAAAYSQYDDSVEAFINAIDITNEDGQNQIKKIARSLNVDVTYDATGAIDRTTTLNAIRTKRTNERQLQNMSLLRGYGDLMESYLQAEAAELRAKNVEARRIYEETQQTIMAYSIASGATKLGWGVGRGIATGVQTGGFLGGVLGALGIAYGEAKPDNELNRGLNELDASLETQVDAKLTELNINDKSDNNVLGVVEATGQNGETQLFAMVDLDGDGSVDGLVEVSDGSISDPSSMKLNWSNVQLPTDSNGNVQWASDPYALKAQISLATNTPMAQIAIQDTSDDMGMGVVKLVTIGDDKFAFVRSESGSISLHELTQVEADAKIGAGSGETAAEVGVNDKVAVAKPGDSQWTLIADAIKLNNPNLTQNQIDVATANVIQEAGAGGVYKEIYENRSIEVNGEMVPKLGMPLGGAVQPKDELSFEDILDMAPRTGASIATAGGYSTETVTAVTNELPANSGGGSVDTGISETPTIAGESFNYNGVLLLGGETGNEIHGTITFADGTLSGSGPVVPGDDSTAQATDDDVKVADDKPNLAARIANLFNPSSGANEVVADNSAKGATFIPANAGGAAVADSPVAQPISTAADSPAVETVTQPSFTDRFTIVVPGWNNDVRIIEDTVEKIIITQKFGNAVSTVELDPSEYDIKSIIPGKGITFNLADGTPKTMDTRGMDIQLQFFGNDEPVSVSGEGLIARMNTALSELQQSAAEAKVLTGSISESANTLGQDLREIGTNLGAVGNEIKTGLGDLTQGTQGMSDVIREIQAQTGMLTRVAHDSVESVGQGFSDKGIIFDQGPLGAGDDFLLYREPQLSYTDVSGMNHYSQVHALALGSATGDSADIIIDADRVIKVGANSEIMYYDNNNVVQTISDPNLHIFGIGEVFAEDGSKSYSVKFDFTGQQYKVREVTDPFWDNSDFTGTNNPVIINVQEPAPVTP